MGSISELGLTKPAGILFLLMVFRIGTLALNFNLGVKSLGYPILYRFPYSKDLLTSLLLL